MWGTRNGTGVWFASDRFIPTHVGNSKRVFPVKGVITVHPHACGELRIMRNLHTDSIGSSPRMWGTHREEDPNVMLPRFIPTHVGNSRIVHFSKNLSTVHPHACGELERGDVESTSSYGSSPRMWGTPGQSEYVSVPHRFIPTHVGNSFTT